MKCRFPFHPNQNVILDLSGISIVEHHWQQRIKPITTQSEKSLPTGKGRSIHEWRWEWLWLYQELTFSSYSGCWHLKPQLSSSSWDAHGFWEFCCPRHGLPLHHHQQPAGFLHLPGVLPPQPAGTTVWLLLRTLLILISLWELMQSMLCLYRCKSNTIYGSKWSRKRKLSLRSTHSPAGPCRNPLNIVR